MESDMSNDPTIKAVPIEPWTAGISIMANGCTYELRLSLLHEAACVNVNPVPLVFANSGTMMNWAGCPSQGFVPDDRGSVLSWMRKNFPNLVVVDYTHSEPVLNDNVALYCKVGVPFVISTSGIDMSLLYKTVAGSNAIVLLSDQMDKQRKQGKSIGVESTMDAVLFLAKKMQMKSNDDKQIYDMSDVLREGKVNLRGPPLAQRVSQFFAEEKSKRGEESKGAEVEQRIGDIRLY